LIRLEKIVILLNIKCRVKTRGLTNMKTVGHLTRSATAVSKVSFETKSMTNFLKQKRTWRHKKEKSLH